MRDAHVRSSATPASTNNGSPLDFAQYGKSYDGRVGTRRHRAPRRARSSHRRQELENTTTTQAGFELTAPAEAVVAISFCLVHSRFCSRVQSHASAWPDFEPGDHDVRVELRSFRLEMRPFVPVDAQPLERGGNAADPLRLRAFPVGVLDPQDELPATFSRDEPVIKQSGCMPRRRGNTPSAKGRIGQRGAISVFTPRRSRSTLSDTKGPPLRVDRAALREDILVEDVQETVVRTSKTCGNIPMQTAFDSHVSKFTMTRTTSPFAILAETALRCYRWAAMGSSWSWCQVRSPDCGSDAVAVPRARRRHSSGGGRSDRRLRRRRNRTEQTVSHPLRDRRASRRRKPNRSFGTKRSETSTPHPHFSRWPPPRRLSTRIRRYAYRKPMAPAEVLGFCRTRQRHRSLQPACRRQRDRALRRAPPYPVPIATPVSVPSLIRRSDAAGPQLRPNVFPRKSGEVKAIQVHHLVPSSHEVAHKRLLASRRRHGLPRGLGAASANRR